ncbi:MAG: glutamate ABC transporter substrate-binding protein [Geodermatophilaceae bacterium]|nr:glutamate ABC transporter substrate-binding protein [Geodermatophilaceae bacterium]
MGRNRSLRSLAAAAVIALAVTACGSDEPAAPVAEDVSFDAGTTMARLNEAGEITIGTKFDQPLFGLRGPSGDPEGFDVEIGKIIAGALGIPEDGITWTETVSANREQFIQDGDVDIVIATYTINDERKELVSFAGPYFIAGQTLMVLEGNTDLAGTEDLVAGVTVCTVEGSTPAERIRTEYPDVEVLPAAGYADCLEPLRNGQVDAVTTDNVILSGFVAQNEGEFKIVGDPFSEEPYGIGLMLEDTEFRTFINETLTDSYENGSWDAAWEGTAGEVLDLPEPPEVDDYS